MDKEKLKAEYPDLYASLIAEGREAGKAEGKAEFQKMASAHMKAAKTSGDTMRAIEDIAAGNELDSECMLHHLAVAQKRAMIADRQDETVAAIGEGEKPIDSALAAVNGKKENDDDVLVKEAKAFYAGKVIHV